MEDYDGKNFDREIGLPASAGVNTYQLTDNVHTMFGSHTIRFGYDGRRYISPLNYAWRIRNVRV